MFGHKIKLFKLMGFEVHVDLSWILIAVLIVWSLSVGFFPSYYKNLSPQTYWVMGVAGALGLFLSIVVHELAHSLVARRGGQPIKGITLFIFGGVAEMTEEPKSPQGEFWMAIVGPATSVALGVTFFVGSLLFRPEAGSSLAFGVLRYLSWINFILAGFNMVPAFPLDGGRVLRSILWGLKKNLSWATRVSSRIGTAFGFLLVFIGVFQFLTGNFIGGMWWFLIGMFLQGAAKTSYQQLLTRRALEGEPVRRFMQREPVTVSPDLTLDRLVEDTIYRYHHTMYPVLEDGHLSGYITTKDVRKIRREDWGLHTVSEITKRASPENTVSPETDAMKALSLMTRTGESRLLVTEGERLVGILSLKDLLRFFALKVELEEI